MPLGIGLLFILNLCFVLEIRFTRKAFYNLIASSHPNWLVFSFELNDLIRSLEISSLLLTSKNKAKTEFLINLNR